MEHPVTVSGLSPQAEKTLSPEAPPQLKMMAASGLAPLGPVDLVTVLYVLAYDSDEVLSQKAGDTLVKLPDNVLYDTLTQDLGEGVIDGLARLLVGRADAVHRIILNQSTGDETIQWITTKLSSEKSLEMIAANEQRMLRHPTIIEALYLNKFSRMSTVDRAVELAIRHGLVLDGIPTFHEAKKAIEGELIFEASDEASEDDVAFHTTLTSDLAQDIEPEKIEELLQSRPENESEESTEKEDKKVQTLEASIAGLTVSQKVRMAMIGNASQRTLLIRDANKLVSMAVLKSPAIGESEVARFSKAKSLPEEAIRYIASRREWTKQYAIKLNLVNNPRCPLQDSLRFLQYLRPNDVKLLEMSRDVPGAISRAAKQLRQKRGN